MRILTGGDDVYLFDDGDETADMQLVVMIGANLDVGSWSGVSEERWVAAQTRLEADAEGDLQIIDCRKAVRS
jgi:hypothetical protein